MHNKLRRDIVAFVNRDRATPTSVTAEDLLTRALNALGGPVVDQRPDETPVDPASNVYTEAVRAGIEPNYNN